jgi:sugar porter (SP) family MFS transporter
VLFAVSALGTAFAPNPYVFSFFRFIGGLGIGISSVVAPTYISEISTTAERGRLTAMYQFNIVFGILIAYISNYLLQGIGGADDWRWMLGVLAIPSIIYTLMVLRVPESPRWLVSIKNDVAGAKAVLFKLGNDNPDDEVNKIIAANAEIDKGQKESIFSNKYKTVLWLAFFVAFFNQWSGINFILYYAPQILTTIGLGAKESLANSIAIGGTNLVFTFVGLYFIDRLGRKTLLIVGSIGYIISLAMVAVAFKMGLSPAFLMSFLLLFIASHAIGQGAVIWVFIAEIFPNKVRALGQSFGASTHWVFAGVITLITPIFLDKDHGTVGKNPWPIFTFLAGMMVLQLIWVLTKVPETKGVSLEELEKKLIKH